MKIKQKAERRVCDKQYNGSTVTKSRAGANNYKIRDQNFQKTKNYRTKRVNRIVFKDILFRVTITRSATGRKQ